MGDPAVARPGARPRPALAVGRGGGRRPGRGACPLAAARNRAAQEAPPRRRARAGAPRRRLHPLPGLVAPVPRRWPPQVAGPARALLCGTVRYLPALAAGEDYDLPHLEASRRGAPGAAGARPRTRSCARADLLLFWSLSFAVSRRRPRRSSSGFDEAFVGYGGEDTDLAHAGAGRPAGRCGGWAAPTPSTSTTTARSPPVRHAAAIARNANRVPPPSGAGTRCEGWLEALAARGRLEHATSTAGRHRLRAALSARRDRGHGVRGRRQRLVHPLVAGPAAPRTDRSRQQRCAAPGRPVERRSPRGTAARHRRGRRPGRRARPSDGPTTSGEPAAAERHHRCAAGHRLGRDQAERLLPHRGDEGRGTAPTTCGPAPPGPGGPRCSASCPEPGPQHVAHVGRVAHRAGQVDADAGQPGGAARPGAAPSRAPAGPTTPAGRRPAPRASARRVDAVARPPRHAGRAGASTGRGRRAAHRRPRRDTVAAQRHSGLQPRRRGRVQRGDHRRRAPTPTSRRAGGAASGCARRRTSPHELRRPARASGAGAGGGRPRNGLRRHRPVVRARPRSASSRRCRAGSRRSRARVWPRPANSVTSCPRAPQPGHERVHEGLEPTGERLGDGVPRRPDHGDAQRAATGAAARSACHARLSRLCGPAPARSPAVSRGHDVRAVVSALAPGAAVVPHVASWASGVDAALLPLATRRTPRPRNPSAHRRTSRVHAPPAAFRDQAPPTPAQDGEPVPTEHPVVDGAVLPGQHLGVRSGARRDRRASRGGRRRR